MSAHLHVCEKERRGKRAEGKKQRVGRGNVRDGEWRGRVEKEPECVRKNATEERGCVRSGNNTVVKMVATVNFSRPENHFDSGRHHLRLCAGMCVIVGRWEIEAGEKESDGRKILIWERLVSIFKQ